MDSVCLRIASMVWNVPGKHGPHGELFFFLIWEEPATVPGSETFSPFFNAHIRTSLFSADVFPKCALIALHVIAEEGRDGDGCPVRGLGGDWKMGCPKSPMWESEGEAWSEDESVSSSGSREGNVCNDALHVIRLYGPGGKISRFLQDCDLAKGMSCHMALDMLCQEMHGALVAGLPLPKCPLLSQLEKPFSHRGRDVTKKGEGCGERK